MSLGLIAIIGFVTVGLVLLVLRAVLLSRRAAVTTGIEGLLGTSGVATSELAPNGTVELNDEAWRARAEDAPIRRGEKVKVVAVEGVTLRVIRREPQATA